MVKVDISVAVYQNFKIYFALLPNYFFVSMYESPKEKYITIEDIKGNQIPHSFDSFTFDGEFLQKVYNWLQ